MVFSKRCFAGSQPRSAREAILATARANCLKTLTFRCALFTFSPHGLWPPSEHGTLKNTVWKTPSVTPCVSKQCPADGVWSIGRGGSPDRVLKARFTPSESSAGHGLPPQRAPTQCPANGVRRVLSGFVSRHGLLDTGKKHRLLL